MCLASGPEAAFIFQEIFPHGRSKGEAVVDGRGTAEAKGSREATFSTDAHSENMEKKNVLLGKTFPGQRVESEGKKRRGRALKSVTGR